MVVLLGINWKNKKDEPDSNEPISLTSADIENTPGPLERERDWIHIQEETDSDGNPKGETIFHGYDDGEGNTDWYTSDGFLDCTTPTPSENSLQWEEDIADGNVIRCD